MTISEPKSRYEWVDIARGYGIILVVIGHACGGIIDTSLIQKSDHLYYIFFAIYTFHMALFFFLAGLFITARIESGSKKFIQGAASKIAKPYFIWSAIQVSIIFMMSSVVNTPITDSIWVQYLKIFWSPPSQFWFLYVLFLLQIISLLLLPRLGAVAMLLFFIALRIFIPQMPIELGAVIGFVAANGLYFAVGVIMGPILKRNNIFAYWPKVGTVATACLWGLGAVLAYRVTEKALGTGFLFPMNAATIANIKSHSIYLIPIIFGTTMILYLSQIRLPKINPLISYLGKLSMPIFLMHVIFVSGSRIFLFKLYPDINVFGLLTCISLIGIIVPVIIFEVTKRIGLAKPLGFI